MLTYQDYLNFVARQGDQDNRFSGMSEQDWNRLSPDRQWANVGGGLMLSNQDPRYGELAGLLGENDPDRYLLAGPQGDWDSSWMIDPNRMVQRNGVNVSTSGNETAASQAGNDFGIVQHGWMLPLAAWAAAGAGLMGAEAGGAGAFEGAAAEGALSGSGAIDSSLLGSIEYGPASTWNPALTGSPEIFSAEALGNGAGIHAGEQIMVNGSRIPPMGPEINPSLLGPAAGIAASTFNPTLDPSPEITPSGERPWYQGLLDNPLQTLGRGYSLFQMGRGLLNNNEPPPPSNNGDGKGGNGDGVTIPPFQRGQYQPNAITAAQLQNFQFARPRGM